MMRCLVGVSLVLAAPWPPAREIPKEELPKTYCEFERTVIQPCAVGAPRSRRSLRSLANFSRLDARCRRLKL